MCAVMSFFSLTSFDVLDRTAGSQRLDSHSAYGIWHICIRTYMYQIGTMKLIQDNINLFVLN